VPSLSLVKQTLEVYLRESVANKEKIEWLCVCSDEGIGKNDDVVVHTNEIGVPCITDKQFIANWLKANKHKKTVIFTTYQSGKTIADACKMAKASFDPSEDRFIRGIIKRKVNQLIGRAGFTLQDRESLEQELFTRVLQSLPRFNPEVAHRNKFVTAVVERYVANMLRNKKAEKRWLRGLEIRRW
jgi:hypothetical protein